MATDPLNIGMEMKRKEVTNTFTIIYDYFKLKKPTSVYIKIYERLKG